MNPFENISAENLHHTFLVVGRPGADVAEFLKPLIGTANPDTQHIVCDTLTVDYARKIAVDASRKSFAGGKKFFIIETNVITEEAQNALLKIFEEPTPDTHFFVIMPQDILLPTLRSRMQVVSMSRVPFATNSKVARGTLDIPIADRLAMVKEITDGIVDEEKTKQDAVNLLNNIESELYQNGVEKSAGDLALCQKTRAFLYDRGAPVKMILENLMISLG